MTYREALDALAVAAREFSDAHEATKRAWTRKDGSSAVRSISARHDAQRAMRVHLAAVRRAQRELERSCDADGRLTTP